MMEWNRFLKTTSVQTNKNRVSSGILPNISLRLTNLVFRNREIRLNSFNAAQGYFRSKDKDAKIFENHPNPVMLVFIR